MSSFGRSTTIILLGIYLFIGIFSPNITRVPSRYFILAVNLLVLAYVAFSGELIVIGEHLQKIAIGFVPFLALFIVQQLIHVVLGNHNGYIVSSAFKMLLVVLFIGSTVLAVVSLIQLLGITQDDLLCAFTFAAFLQLICVLLAFVFPEVKQFFVSLILTHSGNDTVIEAVGELGYFRCFGFAENLFDMFGYITAILITLVFLWGLEKQRILICMFALILVIMPLLNARTGIVLSAIGVFIGLLYYFDPKKVLGYAIVVLVVAILGYLVIGKLSKDTTNWLIKGYQDTVELFHGNIIGTYSEILGVDIVFPDNILFGAGGSPEKVMGLSGIDSGYIQCLWRFGLIGTLLLFAGYVNMFRTLHRCSRQKLNRALSLALGIFFFLYLFKLFSLTAYTTVFLLFVIVASLTECSATSQTIEDIGDGSEQ